MLKLMKLEIKKFRFKGTVRGVMIANLAILAFFILIVLGDKTEAATSLPDYASWFFLVGTVTKVTFSIFAATLIGRLIIGEFNKKTIMVLFMYPISRKKLLAAKLAIIVIFTFVSIFLSDLVIGFLLYIFNSFYPIISESLTGAKVAKFFVSALLDAVAFSGVSLLPLYFGMRKKSVSATILSGVLISSLISSNSNGFSLSSIIAIPLSLAAVGVLVAYWTIRNIESQDVVCE